LPVKGEGGRGAVGLGHAVAEDEGDGLAHRLCRTVSIG
jgi:hypothetical protein